VHGWLEPMPADGLLAMADELALSTLMVLMTVAVHGFGLSVLAKILRVEAFEEYVRHVPALSFRSLVFTQALVLALFVLHGIEIWLYGFVYVWVGAIEDLSTAVYFSTISYAAIGYSDVHIAPEWRLVGAIEGINGLLLLGWSTAFFVAVVIRLGRR
jgi:Ion channel